MKKLFVALFVLLTSFNFALADLDLPKDCRVPNQSPGRCVWASAECLGRSLGYTQLKGLTARNARRGNSIDAFRTLRNLGVPVECSQQVSRVFGWSANGKVGTCFSLHRIEEICNAGHAVCAVVWTHDQADKHMIVVLSINQKTEKVKIWDSNLPDQIQELELAWLYRNFDGGIMEIPPKKD